MSYLPRFITAIGLALLFAGSTWAQGKIRASAIWRAAELEGRTLWVSEQSVALRVDNRTELQVGWQRFVAKGRVRTNRFSTSARWFGAERSLWSEGNRRIVLSLRRLEGEEGVAEVTEGLFTYVPPRIDTASLSSIQRARKRTVEYCLSYSRTHAGMEAADTIGLSVNTIFEPAMRWRIQLESGIYADRHEVTTYRSVFSGIVTLPLGRDLHVQLGATFAPRGFPVAGTSIEGFTAFALYRPGSLVESWRDRPAGYLSVQLSTGR